MKFLVDRMCGRLATWLRLLGYDAEYVSDTVLPEQIIFRSLREMRIILTRNLKLSRQKGYRVYRVKGSAFMDQVKEVVKEFDIKIDLDNIFTRCIKCNGKIEAITKEEAMGKVPEYVYQTCEQFYACCECRKIYWQGSHLALAEKILAEIG